MSHTPDQIATTVITAGVWEAAPLATIEIAGVRFEMSPTVLLNIMNAAIIDMGNGSLTREFAFGGVMRAIRDITNKAITLETVSATEEQLATQLARYHETGCGGVIDLSPVPKIMERWKLKDHLSDTEWSSLRHRFASRGNKF